MRKSARRIELVMVGPYALQQRDSGKWKARGTQDLQGRGFMLCSEPPSRWKVSGISSSGSQVRRQFDAPGLTEAVEEASRILYPKTQPIPTPPDFDLADAFNRALSDIGGGVKHRHEMRKGAGYFIAWAEGRSMRFWRQITYEVVRRYMMDLAGRGLRKKTISHYLQPVRVASRFMNATYPDFYHDATRTLRIPHSLA